MMWHHCSISGFRRSNGLPRRSGAPADAIGRPSPLRAVFCTETAPCGALCAATPPFSARRRRHLNRFVPFRLDFAGILFNVFAIFLYDSDAVFNQASGSCFAAPVGCSHSAFLFLRPGAASGSRSALSESPTRRPLPQGFFHGYSPVVMVMIVNHALSGIAVRCAEPGPDGPSTLHGVSSPLS